MAIVMLETILVFLCQSTNGNCLEYYVEKILIGRYQVHIFSVIRVKLKSFKQWEFGEKAVMWGRFKSPESLSTHSC